MVERIEDLNLPTAVVTRLIKDALPPNSFVSKEARAAIARAASVFVIYLTASSTTLARKAKLKTITAKNILDALDQLEFESFVGPLNEELESYRKNMKDKKDSKASAAAAKKEDITEAAEKRDNEQEPDTVIIPDDD
ncbi:DNA polymerase epsilon subunit 3 [Condylostylus longicornis]|uniref:DNA polymerase epsilon subunit 3 n=1 Tax=Condylostylus longicornis TaxID=2530218 RepID=UPI00244E1C39|nr:DNA polymerase epsilon subunit 3 [Condylostylus longicornis]